MARCLVTILPVAIGWGLVSCGLVANITTLPTSVDGGAVDTGAVSASPYVATVLADSPVAYFRLGESSASEAAANEVPGGVNGSYTGGLSLGAMGAIAGDPDTAVSLVGGSINLGTSAFEFAGNSPFTLEAWVATTTAAHDQEILVKRDSDAASGSLNGWVLFVAQGDTVCLERWYGSMAANQADMVCSTVALTEGQYSHVAATYDGATLAVYVRGQLSATATSTAMISSTVSPCLIGNDYYFKPSNVEGRVDEVALYDYALSAGRILAHEEAGIGELSPDAH